HHTEAEVWQPRWLDHPNTVSRLLGILIVTNDLPDASERFERLLGVAPARTGRGVRFDLPRGHVHAAGPEQVSFISAPPPGLPWIAAYGLQAESLERVATFMTDAKIPMTRCGDAILAAFPTALGIGYWAFVEDEGALPWN